MGNSNTYIKSGLWTKTDKPVNGYLNLDQLVTTITDTLGEGPTITYVNEGTVDSLDITFGLAVNPADTYNPTGAKTVKSYYVPSINVSNSDSTYNTFTSLTFPDLVLSGVLTIHGSNFTTFNAPLLEKVLIRDAQYNSIEIYGSQLVNIDLPKLSYILGNAIFDISSSVTSFSLPKLSYSGGLNIGSYESSMLTTVSLPLFYRDVAIRNCPLLTTVILSETNYKLNLEGCQAFDTITTLASYVSVQTDEFNYDPATLAHITTVDAPNATYFSLNNFFGSSISLPSATYVNIIFRESPASISFNFPLMTNGAINIINSLLTSFTMPSTITRLDSVYSSNNTLLTSISLGAIGTIKEIGQNGQSAHVYLRYNALNAASVNAVLALLVSLDGTNGTTLYENATVFLDQGTNAAPTGQGLTDKATLESRGCTVYTE
jgi:hypothetical protein